jgi:hypothetical protein
MREELPMPLTPQRSTRKLTIIAQDPSVLVRKTGPHKILTEQVDVPAEDLSPGPTGYRVRVIDYDSSGDRLYAPLTKGLDGDPFEKATDSQLLNDPRFHAQNVYAIVMRTLARFELALGRRVSWSFQGHQIQVAPHAFADANAFYSERDRALVFGYFPKRENTGEMVFACLSHDVVAHETTHALVDGLRTRYTDPSSPDQAGFHEGFADIVALLSMFSLRNVIEMLLDLSASGSKRVAKEKVTPRALRESILMGMAEQMGEELSGVRGQALRRSATMLPSPAYLTDPEYEEPHRRGEILVAAVMHAFLSVWSKRLSSLGEVSKGYLDRGRVAEDGADAAEQLLTICIRALDYAPPTDLEFSDFLTALLTADSEIVPDDSKYQYRKVITQCFADYGIVPTSKGDGGIWEAPDSDFVYNRTHFEPMQRDPDEVFRFIWENRKALALWDDAFTYVQSVRPCLRLGPDGFVLRETVAEYIQMLDLRASELAKLKIKPPKDMPPDFQVTLYGGGAMVFDEFGGLKFHARNRILNQKRQTRRLEYLWKYGFLSKGASALRRFAYMHRQRATNQTWRIPED